MKALIVYGTRNGATKAIADEIGKTLAGQGYETTVKDARDTKGVDVNAFDLVVVGSSVWAGAWTGKTTGFLKENQAVLAGKKVALFSSGISQTDPDKAEVASQGIAKVAGQHPSIRPIAMACFGGYMDFRSGGLAVRLIGAPIIKKDLAKKGIDTSTSYDTRDFTAIRRWAEDVAAKAR